MKPLLFAMLMLMVSVTSFSQQTSPSPTLTKQEFILKSKHQKTAAWVLLGGGFALSSISIVAATPKASKDIGRVITILPSAIVGISPQPELNNDYTVETVLLIGGVAAIASSITLFIAAAKNKGRGMSLSFKNESALQSLRGSLVNRSVPSLNFKISL